MKKTLLIILLLAVLPALHPARSGAIEAVEVTAPGNRQPRLAVEMPRGLEGASTSRDCQRALRSDLL